MNTGKVIAFTLTMTTVVALLLSIMFFATKGTAEANEAIFNKRAILRAVEDALSSPVDDLSDEQVVEVFNNQVTQKVLDMNGEEVKPEVVEAAGYKGGRAEDIDMAKERKKLEEDRMLPLFIFSPENAKENIYVLSVRGNGLWDEIWGNIAIKMDDKYKAVIVGTAFDHKAETPGLGAEIKDNPAWAAKFKDNRIYNEEGEYVAVNIVKGSAKNEYYEVDGISGATVTSVGVGEMIYRGIKYYEPYLDEVTASVNMKN